MFIVILRFVGIIYETPWLWTLRKFLKLEILDNIWLEDTSHMFGHGLGSLFPMLGSMFGLVFALGMTKHHTNCMIVYMWYVAKSYGVLSMI